MKYTPSTYAKAIVAFLVALVGAVSAAGHGADWSMDVGSWIIALGAALTAGGAVFATPNKPGGNPIDVANADVIRAADSIKRAQEHAELLAEKAREGSQKAAEAVETMRGVTRDLSNPLVEELINEFKRGV